MNTPSKTIDEYIRLFPKNIQALLREMRQAVKAAAPKAEEAIKYGMPTLVLEGNLVHFAAFKKHIGFYPAPSAIKAFKKELSAYQCSKGAIQFPMEKPLPLALVKNITRFRVRENQDKARSKKKA